MRRRMASRSLSPVLLERLVDAVDQVLVAKGLLDEVDRAVLHRLDRHRHVAVAGDEDDRHDRMHLVQALLQLEAAHAGHAYVEHEAAGPIGVEQLEKLLRRAEGFDRQPDRLQQQPQRSAYRIVVVDHEHGRGLLLHLSLLAPAAA
jgi:hypothetical protein